MLSLYIDLDSQLHNYCSSFCIFLSEHCVDIWQKKKEMAKGSHLNTYFTFIIYSDKWLF